MLSDTDQIDQRFIRIIFHTISSKMTQSSWYFISGWLFSWKNGKIASVPCSSFSSLFAQQVIARILMITSPLSAPCEIRGNCDFLRWLLFIISFSSSGNKKSQTSTWLGLFLPRSGFSVVFVPSFSSHVSRKEGRSGDATMGDFKCIS